MDIKKQVGLGAIAGIISGFLQGSPNLPEGVNFAEPTSIENLGFVAGFGGLCGFVLGMYLLSKATKEDFKYGFYTYFFIGSLSIGISNLESNFGESFEGSFSLLSALFLPIGIAMALGGLLSYVFSRNT